jgi:hypothetical protein
MSSVVEAPSARQSSQDTKALDAEKIRRLRAGCAPEPNASRPLKDNHQAGCHAL